MKYKILLIAALVLGLVLRVYRISDYPALNADEAAIGYNAYSLLETGKDEHGNPWPLQFQSFNDFKPGGYFYLVIPFVELFGLNTISVRMPSVILGVLSIYVIYLLTELLLNKKIDLGKYNISLGEIAAFFLAVSPWHIHFSRGGWEVNAATFFILLGVTLFLYFLKFNKYLYLSVISFCVAMYTYHSARVIVPILILGLFAIFYKDLLIQKRKVSAGIILGAILILPLLYQMIYSKGVLARAGGVSIFADRGVISGINEQRGEHENLNSIQAKVLHNKAVNYGFNFLENWSSHYWGEFLFLSGDEIQRNRVPETGQLYMIDSMFVVLGIFYAVRLKTKGSRVILFWLLMAPVAAGLTFQSPHALRAHNMVIPITIISAIGFMYMINLFRQYKRISRFGIGLILLLVIWSFIRYQIMYWLHMSKEYPYSSQYGVAELVDFISKNEKNYQKIVMTDKYDQPYILFLFYLKYSPEKFQTEHILTPVDEFGFSTVRNFDKYEFRSINFEIDKRKYNKSLIVGTDEEIPQGANIIKEIYFDNGDIAFQIVSN